MDNNDELTKVLDEFENIDNILDIQYKYLKENIEFMQELMTSTLMYKQTIINNLH